ncbi:BC1872 family protein [Aneurinibacillus aneurinilyticus]|jgi:hypothetical protein|uniref:BC1872 family protein n=1 Tax=Aneurinibacillus aneurinilyticus TaxID=1391 RepID=UPI003672BC57
MKACRELDGLIATKVFGYKIAPIHADEDLWILDDSQELHVSYPVPHYSTNIADAWQVVEKFKECDLQKHESGNYTCYITLYKTYESDAETAPLAICLAALKAIGVEVCA